MPSLYRFSFLLAVLVLATPVHAQTEASLYGLTDCCPNRIVTFDASTGETTDIAEIGGADDRFNALVGSGVYDPVNDRVFMVRNGSYIAADIETGEVAELFDAGPFSQFAGFDASRGVFYVFTVEKEAGETEDITLITNRLVRVDPDTEETTEVAVVGGGVSDEDGYEGDVFGSVTGPAVLASAPARLFTVRNGRFLSTSLPGGTLDEQAEADSSDLLAYAPERGTLLTYTRDLPAGGVGEAKFFISEYDPATGEQTDQVQVGSGVFVEEGGVQQFEGDVFTVSTGIALLDSVGDRVLLNRNGTLVEVDVAKGTVAERTELGDIRIIGSPSAITTDAEGQPDAAAFQVAVYPNPFRDAARLDLNLEQSDEVRVEAFDLLGRRVAVLHEGRLPAGRTTLDEIGEALSPGVYLVRVESESERQTLRLVRLD